MTTESAVSFPTPTRVHVALAVRDTPRATSFYRALLGQEPTKERGGYAKFDVFDPPLNLSLNQTPQVTAPPLPQHFGIQVKQHAAISAIAKRMAAAGFAGESEDQVTCCHAVQDKVWVTDPDGHRWEIFIVTQADTVEHSKDRVGPTATDGPACCTPIATAPVASEPEPLLAPEPEQDEAPCCAPTCCQ